ncbi:MAG: hypothetical protein QM731_07735 [Chitinophagaceae bacterium]
MRCLLVRYCLVFFAVIQLCSCHFFEPTDSSAEQPFKELKDLQGLPGVWNATDRTYEMLKKKEYKSGGVKLTLRSDSSFEFMNLPDCINSPSGDIVNRKSGNANGKWNVYSVKDRWELQMAFNEGELFPKKTFLSFEISQSGRDIKLWQYIGDPDMAEVLEFERRK